MLTMFGAEIIGNSCSESRKRHFWRPEIQKFSGGACPRTPLVKSASGARLSIGRAVYTSNPSMQKAGYAPVAFIQIWSVYLEDQFQSYAWLRTRSWTTFPTEWKMNVNFSQSLLQAPKR